MKKTLLTGILIWGGLLGAQCFKRGTIVLDANTGLEVYRSRSTYRNAERDTTTERMAGNAVWTAGIEVGLTRRIGLGLRAKATTYQTVLDAVTRERALISSREFTGFVNCHLLRRKRLDFLVGMEAGLSRLRIDPDNLSRSEIRTRGAYHAFYLQPRFYAGRFGFNLRAYLPRISYTGISGSGAEPMQFYLNRWKASGFGVTVGVQFRLF